MSMTKSGPAYEAFLAEMNSPSNDELVHQVVDITNALTATRKQLAVYRAAMEEVRNELEEDFDINENGGPNKAMRLANMIDEAIYGPGGF